MANQWLLRLVIHTTVCYQSCMASSSDSSETLTGLSAVFYSEYQRRAYLFCKRLLDILVSALLLVPAIPVLIVLAVLMKITMPGPVLFRQQRGGLNGKSFTIYKLRSFHAEKCDEGLKQVRPQDDRVAPFGKWLRQCSLDEIPQLYNILRGDMSLIGPRPHTIGMDAHYADYIPHYFDRYQVKPGLTGYAQVYGARGETRQVLDMAHRVELDLWYIARQSMWLDLRILLRTVVIFIRDLC